jgi:hypothetical protein
MEMTMTNFTYGLRARPPAIGAVPTGFDSWTQFDDVPESIASDWHVNNYRHGLLTYTTVLTASQISSYELIDMNIKPTDTLWGEFVELCTNLVEYEIPFTEFVADYVHPHGDVRENNPFHTMKPAEFFTLLENKGYPGDLEGLSAFYEQL